MATEDVTAQAAYHRDLAAEWLDKAEWGYNTNNGVAATAAAIAQAHALYSLALVAVPAPPPPGAPAPVPEPAATVPVRVLVCGVCGTSAGVVEVPSTHPDGGYTTVVARCPAHPYRVPGHPGG